MKTWRYGLVAAGVLLLLFGAVRLIVEVPGSLIGLALWMIGAVVVHDAVLSPLVVGVGWLLARVVPARARRYLQAALISGGLVLIIALPIIHRRGTQPASKAWLLQNYAGNTAVLLGMIAALNLIAYGIAVARDRLAAPPEALAPH